jgi:ABC-type nickel/cobalt efflux system permease component RcnA
MTRRILLTLFTLSLLAAFRAPAADAHPADRLLQHLIVTLYGDHIEASYAVSGGLLATAALAEKIDVDGDGAFSNEEAQAWLQDYLTHITITRDGETIRPSRTTLQVTPLNEFSLGLSPLIVTMEIPTGATAAAEQTYAITNDYRLDLTDFRLDIAETAGGKLTSSPLPGKIVRFRAQVDPSIASGGESGLDAATRWSATGAVSRAQDLFNHRKTPWFIALMMLIFAGMGALHALQPGHGKTLVAAYLVATGGTPRDAMTLAGIVTATHTISVYLLGMLTLIASEWFLPSRVIPVLAIASGLLVVGMGASMLWRATRRWTARGFMPASAFAFAGAMPAHQHAPGHVHSHDHANLSDEEHARLHAQEIDQVMVERGGRKRVDLRQLLTLGVSGGIAPCPDALAILLLSAGIGQAGFGMLAIVCFSIGLALVLVAFGVGVALMRPAVQRLTAGRDTGQGWLGRANAFLDRAMIYSPVMSAVVVFALGIGMLWAAINV